MEDVHTKNLAGQHENKEFYTATHACVFLLNNIRSE